MSDISAQLVKELRDKSGAGFMECKKALVESSGDIEEAQKELRKRGIAVAAKKAGREASEGVIGSYIHTGGKLGVLVEVNCESDFVARTDLFQQLVKDLAMHIAAADPKYVRREEVDQAAIEAESQIQRDRAIAEGKPEKIVDKIVEGRMAKYYEEVCLLEQPFVKDGAKTVQELINEAIASLGEKIDVGRMVRLKVGESSE